MPSKNKKQLNLFKNVKAFVDGGENLLLKKWKETNPGRTLTGDEFEKIKKIANSINYADLEDLTSGIVGDEVLGNQLEIKVGYWMKFKTKYKSGNIEKEGTFIAKITKLRPNEKIAIFNPQDIYNINAVKINPLKRTNASTAEQIWLDYVFFNEIKEIAKSKDELIMKNEIRKLVRSILNESTTIKLNEDLTLQYADRPTANSPIVEIGYDDDNILYKFGFNLKEDEEITLSELIKGIEIAKKGLQNAIEGASDLSSFDFQREIELLKKLTLFAKQSKIDNNNVVMLKSNINHPNQDWIDKENKSINDIWDLQNNQEDFDSYKYHGLSESDNEGLKIKKINSDEMVSVKTGMHVEKKSDKSRGVIKNVGINFKKIPNVNNLNVQWFSGDLSGTKQTVDLDDVEAV
jgi:hypothetical protein